MLINIISHLDLLIKNFWKNNRSSKDKANISWKIDDGNWACSMGELSVKQSEKANVNGSRDPEVKQKKEM